MNSYGIRECDICGATKHLRAYVREITARPLPQREFVFALVRVDYCQECAEDLRARSWTKKLRRFRENTFKRGPQE